MLQKYDSFFDNIFGFMTFVSFDNLCTALVKIVATVKIIYLQFLRKIID